MKIVCKTSQGSTTTWWRWRIIDGKKCWFPGKAVIDKSQLTWDTPAIVVEPKPSLPELALPDSTVLPALSLPAKTQDRLQVADNLGSPKPGLQQYDVKTVTPVPDKPSLSPWLEIVPLVAAALMLVVGDRGREAWAARKANIRRRVAYLRSTAGRQSQLTRPTAPCRPAALRIAPAVPHRSIGLGARA